MPGAQLKIQATGLSGRIDGSDGLEYRSAFYARRCGTRLHSSLALLQVIDFDSRSQVCGMRITRRNCISGAIFALVAFLSLAGTFWLGLNHLPDFYQALTSVASEAQNEKRSVDFVSHSVQLRNDMVNEPAWEAVFTAEEVNAWLAGDLLVEFADKVPEHVSKPRVSFEPDKVTLAFTYDSGKVKTVLWGVASLRVTGPNEVAISFQKLRAGAIPIPIRLVKSQLTQLFVNFGMNVNWTIEGGCSVANLRLSDSKPELRSAIENLQLARGWVRIAGTSRPKSTVSVSR